MEYLSTLKILLDNCFTSLTHVFRINSISVNIASNKSAIDGGIYSIKEFPMMNSLIEKMDENILSYLIMQTMGR